MPYAYSHSPNFLLTFIAAKSCSTSTPANRAPAAPLWPLSLVPSSVAWLHLLGASVAVDAVGAAETAKEGEEVVGEVSR